VQVLHDYVMYLVNIFFIGSYKEYTKTDGIVASKPAATWVVSPLHHMYEPAECIQTARHPRHRSIQYA
jgi:hypothetical protein